MVTALLSTLNNDPNVNVRLATLEALAPLADDPAVRLGLVHSLTRQDSPLVQSALADVMVQLQERRSVKPLRELLRQANLDEVREKQNRTKHPNPLHRPARRALNPPNPMTRPNYASA